MIRWSLAILAGGRSRRMGVDKATLVWDGEPILGRLVRRLAPPAGPTRILARPDQSIMLPEGAVRLDDPDGSEGPLSGLVALSRTFPAEPVLVVPCDMPDLPSGLGAALAEALDDGGADGAVVAPDGRPEPFPCLMGPAAWSAVRAAWDAGERRADAWWRSARLVHVDPAAAFPEAWPQGFLNANEPSDLR